MASADTLVKELKEGLRPVVDLVYPPRCPSCGAAIATHGSLCQDCWGELEFPQNDDKSVDEGSRRSQIIAATIYNEMSRSLILKFKHGGKLALAPLLGRMMASRVPANKGVDPLIIPVPLHRTRIWKRGFNQAAMLAREISRAGKGTLFVDALVRQRRTPSLGNMSAEKRKAALTGAIALHSKARDAVKNREIILVDDVLTSGATSDACVEVLLGGGASCVDIVCFARADRASRNWSHS